MLTIFMILSGTYLLIKKQLISNKSKALLLAKWHAMIGVIIAIPVFVLVLTDCHGLVLWAVKLPV